MSPLTPRQLARLRRRRRDRRGVALVMVLGAIVVLTVFLTEVQQDSSAALSAAIAERDMLRAEYHARSAVNLSRLLIATEPTIRRSIAPMFMMLKMNPPQIPVWEFSDQLLGLFNDAAGAQAFQGLATVDPSTGTNLGLGADGRFEVVVIDEESKININTAARGDIISQTHLMSQLIGLMAPQQYNPLFENPDADDQHSDRATICGAIIDWADSDENFQPCDVTATGPSSTGVEDNYYQTIGLPYLRKNAAFDSLEELRLVRGISDEFWTTFVQPDPDQPRKRNVTVWGRNKINVNTAGPMTLLALVCAGAAEAPLCVDPEQAQNFVMLVTMLRGFTMGAPLFGSPKDFVNTMEGKGMVGPILQSLGVEPVVFKSRTDVENMIDNESKIFSIYAEGVITAPRRETRVRIHAVVDFRQATDLSSLSTATGDEDSSAASGSTATPSAAAPQPLMGGGLNQTEQLTAEQLAAASASDPGGQIIYYRIE